MELHGLLNACDALFASFPRTSEKVPREGQLIPQESGTGGTSLGLGEAWWKGETIVWGLWARWVALDWDGLAVWDLFLYASLFSCFFPDLVLLGADPFSHPVISRSFPFHYFPILFPSFSILFHPCPILSPSYPFLSHPQYSVGLQDLPPERLQDRLENDGSQADLCWFAGFFKDTGWTPGGHYAVRVDTTPCESIRVEP